MKMKTRIVEQPLKIKNHPNLYRHYRQKNLDQLLQPLLWSDLSNIDVSNLLTYDLEMGLELTVAFINQVVPKCYQRMPSLKKMPAFVAKELGKVNKRLKRSQIELNSDRLALQTLDQNGIVLIQTTTLTGIFKQPQELSEHQFNLLKLLYVCWLLTQNQQKVLHNRIKINLFGNKDDKEPFNLKRFSRIVHFKINHHDGAIWLDSLFTFANSLAMAINTKFLYNVIDHEMTEKLHCNILEVDDEPEVTDVEYDNFFTFAESMILENITFYQDKRAEHNNIWYQRLAL